MGFTKFYLFDESNNDHFLIVNYKVLTIKDYCIRSLSY